MSLLTRVTRGRPPCHLTGARTVSARPGQQPPGIGVSVLSQRPTSFPCNRLSIECVTVLTRSETSLGNRAPLGGRLPSGRYVPLPFSLCNARNRLETAPVLNAVVGIYPLGGTYLVSHLLPSARPAYRSLPTGSSSSPLNLHEVGTAPEISGVTPTILGKCSL